MRGNQSVDRRILTADLCIGGDFVDPNWTLFWSEIWLGSGIPERTGLADVVINGNYSMWLGGTESDDALYYPIQFPDEIDTTFVSGIELLVRVADEDIGNDQFCVALISAAGDFIGPYAPNNPECQAAVGDYTYTLTFSAADLADLAGETAYLAVATSGNAAEPHMSAFVDDVALYVDLPNVAASMTPASGPAGTTFLLVGKYNVPYGQVDVCITPCSKPGNYIKSAYADAAGDVAVFVYSQKTTPVGLYNIQTADYADRKGNSALTILGAGVNKPKLTVAPATGPAGTKFVVSGSGFVPNDNLQLSLNGEAVGSVGSAVDGKVAFDVNTDSSTPPGTFTLILTDSADRSATVKFTVTAVAVGEPQLSVDPASGPAGTKFTFTALNFTPVISAQVLLDGQVVGQITPEADGSIVLEVETQADTTPATYTLIIRQEDKEASASFAVTGGGGGGGGGQSGSGLYVTLVWTDPPAQNFAARTLVNDLDLIVTGPSGRVFGNGGNTANRTDNVESVRIESPAAGNYTIQVVATTVNATFGSQPFALVATTKQSTQANTNRINVSNNTLHLPLVRR